jgi:hypothetical protein
MPLILACLDHYARDNALTFFFFFTKTFLGCEERMVEGV